MMRHPSQTSRLCRLTANSYNKLRTRGYSNKSPSTEESIQTPPNTERFSRLSRFWTATGGVSASDGEDGHAKLIRAGYLRQSHAGMFHFLPLGHKVQTKLEALIDKYMLQLGASKVSLSSLSAQSLWHQTNRLEGYGPELFRLTDRKDVPYLLAPTHEEEITSLVAKTVTSYKTLPLRLYQIGRKYRDEIRPRHGVLRSREFVMKDLYTFDYSLNSALSTYNEVRSVYNLLFDELKLPYLVAEATSGDIGGDLSHEYHLPSPIGEDNVISCSNCDYVANEELATARPDSAETDKPGNGVEAHIWRGISKDRKTLVNVWYPSSISKADVNIHAIKSTLPTLDSSVEDALPLWASVLSQPYSSTAGERLKLLNIVDYRLGLDFPDDVSKESNSLPSILNTSRSKLSQIDVEYITETEDGEPINTIRIRDGDSCPRCDSGTLKVQKAIELGHTFHLGTKYSEPLDARVTVPNNLLEAGSSAETGSQSVAHIPMQMGCHGIGISRIIGAVAEYLADDKGLNWPRAIAPFEVAVIPSQEHIISQAKTVSELLTESLVRSSDSIDLVLDDRKATFAWKMKDADLIGIPVIVVLGRRWASERLCEVQCRRLGARSFVQIDDLSAHVNNLLKQL